MNFDDTLCVVYIEKRSERREERVNVRKRKREKDEKKESIFSNDSCINR